MKDLYHGKIAEFNTVYGTNFDSFESFRELLVREEDAFLRCLVEKMMTYALGRGIEFSDEPELKRMINNMQQTDRTLRGLIEDIVTSPLFLTK